MIFHSTQYRKVVFCLYLGIGSGQTAAIDQKSKIGEDFTNL